VKSFLPALAAFAACAQTFVPPDDLLHRRADIISEGTRMAAEIYEPKTRPAPKLPTVVMCHGWGGTAAGLRRQAVDIARAGYLVVVFDYRGWGQSDSRLILTGPAPRDRPGNRFTAEVREVREVVDPVDMTRDLLNAIHWVHGEPGADTARIGLWGSSYSGGHVVWAAARDHRIKALVSQVPGMDSRPLARSLNANQAATRRTRGEIGYPPPRAQEVGKLFGGPIAEKMVDYAPAEDAALVPPHCAQLYIVAGKEELFDNRDHGIKAHSLARGPKKLVTIPDIAHYGIYREAREQATKLAVEWFDAHLKGRTE
jgi:dienelactone hydrolase